MQGNPKLKAYFQSNLQLGVILCVVGIPLIFANGLGLIPIAIGGYFVFTSLGGGNDADADRAMKAAIEWAKKRAHEKNIIDDDASAGEIAAPTEVLTGVHFGNDVLDSKKKPIPTKIRRGSDGRPRFNPVDVTVLIFGRDQIATYQTAVDLIGGGNYAESTEEYFYNDVIGIKNETVSYQRKDKGKDITETVQNVSLVTNSGDRISVTVSVEQGKGAKADWSKYVAGIEPQINNVKKLLRERKSNRPPQG